MPKVTICALIITDREVLIPNVCSECGTNLLEHGYREIMLHDEVQTMKMNEEGEETDRSADAEYGEEFLTIGWQCRECDCMLITGEEIRSTMHRDRLDELFPELKNFDENTGECCLYLECLRALQVLLPAPLRNEPAIIGTYMTMIMHSPNGVGKILMEAAEAGSRIIANHNTTASAVSALRTEQGILDGKKLDARVAKLEETLRKLKTL